MTEQELKEWVGTVQMILPNGKVALIDLDDYERLKGYRWFENSRGYVVRTYGSRRQTETLHSVVNQTPSGLQTDHINGNKMDNRKCNLRSTTPTQNQANQSVYPSRGTSAFKGVHWHKRWNRWQAGTRIKNKKIHLGSFKSEVAAAMAYNLKAVELHGEYAKLNAIRPEHFSHIPQEGGA